MQQIKKIHISKNQGGFSMVDFMLWVGCAIIGIALLLGIFGPLMTTMRTLGLSSELQTFQIKIQEVYHGQGTGYKGISVAEVVKSGAYPTNLNVTGTALSSSATGNITITSDDAQGLNFTIKYDGVPSGVCRSIVNKLSSAGAWYSIGIGGTTVWSGISVNPTKATIDTACNAASKVAMTFTSN